MTRQAEDYNNPYLEVVIEGLKQQGMVRLSFFGQSMLPTLADGMSVEVRGCQASEVRPADIILYRRSGQPIIHRVINIQKDSDGIVFVTKGDNQAYVECASVAARDLIGIVSAANHPRLQRGNVLVANRFFGFLYIGMEYMSGGVRVIMNKAPGFIRNVTGYFIRTFFLILKKLIHFLYLRVRDGVSHIRLQPVTADAAE